MMRARTAWLGVTILALAAATPGAAALSVSDAALLATNSIDIDRDSSITGAVVVNQASAGPTLDPPAELDVDKNTLIDGDVRADSVSLDVSLVVTGTVECNDGGAVCAGLTLPVFQTLPLSRDAQPGTDPVAVGNNQTLVLGPGAYGAVTIGKNGTLVLQGGGFDVSSVVGASGATIKFQAAAQLRVEVEFVLASSSTIEPDGAGLDGSDLVVYVGGTNSDPADPNSAPVVDIGTGSSIQANFYAPNGTFLLRRGSSLTGSVIARDIRIHRGSDVAAASAFNLAPVAIAQTVESQGVNPISFNLSGCDPDGDVLTFTLVSGPSSGTLTGLPGSDPASPDPSCTDAVAADPAVPVTYTAVVEGQTDSFVFQVDDGKGGVDTAVVDINPSDDPPPDPPEVVTAKDVTVETSTDVAVVAPLRGAAPAGVTLTFSILAGPSSGALGAINVLNATDAEVLYTPNPGFNGTDSFDFEVCDQAMPTECDTGTVTVEVDPVGAPVPPEAVDLGYETAIDTPVEIDLTLGPTEEAIGDCGRDDPQDCPGGGGN